MDISEQLKHIADGAKALGTTPDAEFNDKIGTFQSKLNALIAKIEEVEQADPFPDPQSPLYEKHDGRPTDELVGMARVARKEYEETHPDATTGEFLEKLVTEYKSAGENKHEVVTAYADALTAKKDADTGERVARRQLYGAVAKAIADGEIVLDTRRKNEDGEELASFELPSWLPAGIDVQNAVELVYDETQVEAFARMFGIWEIMSVDPKKLERFVKRDNDDRAGKKTAKYALPIPLPVKMLNVVKVTVGKEAGYTPDTE